MNKYFDKRLPLYREIRQKIKGGNNWVRLFTLRRHWNDSQSLLVLEFLTDEEIGQEMGGN